MKAIVELYCKEADQDIGGAVYQYTDEQLTAARAIAGPIPHGGTLDDCYAWFQKFTEAFEAAGAVDLDIKKIGFVCDKDSQPA